MTSFIYKSGDGYSVGGDLYVPEDGHTSRPAVVWIHGGSLMAGWQAKFVKLRESQLQLYLNAGFAVFAIDYRLAPQVKIPDIVEDVIDAVRWIREEGGSSAGVDPARIVLVGHSAGGYLALMGGCTISPPPAAIASLYGYGDISGEWATEPFYYERTPSLTDELERAYLGLPLRTTSEPDHDKRRPLVRHLREQGRWVSEAAGIDPHKDPEGLLPFCPRRRITSSFPPAIQVHGTADDNVPYQQAVLTAVELDRKGVEHEFISIEGGVHGFDTKMADNPQVIEAIERVVDFLVHHTQS